MLYRTCSPENEFRQRARCKTCRTLLGVGPLGVAEEGSGDVQVRPVCVAHEMLQDFGCRYRGGWPPAGLLDIGNITVNGFSVLVVQGHTPELLADLLPGFDDLGAQCVVVAEQARHDRAERN